MVNPQPSQAIEPAVYTYYQATPAVCAWLFHQIDQLREQAQAVVNRYTEGYIELIRQNSAVARYPLGIKLEWTADDKRLLGWGVGRWSNNQFIETRLFALPKDRYRFHYLDHFLAKAPLELKTLVFETEDQLESIRKFNKRLTVILELLVKYTLIACHVNKQETKQNLDAVRYELKRLSSIEDAANSFSNNDALKLWLCDQAALLEKEAEYYVSYYWSNNKKDYSLETPSISLGLRIKSNRGNSISIEWYEAKFLGQKAIEKKRYKKPRNVHHYSILEKIVQAQPEWFAKLVIETEDELARIRKQMWLLAGIKEALLDYQNV
ncbi:conjugative transfer protein MobI(A/C) (plasmid) [Methylomonas sp. MED-D]|uniref:conjugative transfer protein MobI(A/C) n=1 Tax=Methylomonas sp. MED-D TaxID=3418768 RepID=UPI003D00E16E